METVTLDALEGELEAENYPLAREDVREEYGDYVLDLPGGEERVGDVLGRVDVENFPDHAAVVESIQTGVGAEGVGRRDYTDRGTSAGDDYQESF